MDSSAACGTERLLAPVKLNGRWGFVNTAGEVKIDFQYDNVRPFSEGLAAVNIGAWQNEDGCLEGGRWGFIDAHGQAVIGFQFEEAGSFRDGLASVREYEKLRFGFIDRKGRVVVAPSFDHAALFSEGLALVR